MPKQKGNQDRVHLRPIYNYPVVPEESSRHQGKKDLPVTRTDLGTDFRNAFSFFSNDWRTSPIFRQVFFDARLGSVLWHPWYGAGEDISVQQDPAKKGTQVPGGEKAAKEYARKGLFIHGFNSKASSEISQECHDKMRAIFGRRWMGYTEGEWDGAYIGMIASGKIALAPGRSRAEACRHFIAWMDDVYNHHHRHMTTVASLGFGCHYSAELGSRMMGLELGECLPSDTVMMAFCRGASRQYDLLMVMYPSVFAIRGAHGFKCYPPIDQPQSVLSEGYLTGPDHGSTLGLLKRLWWISYMNGSSVIGNQFGYFPCEGGKSVILRHGAIPLEDPVTMEKVMAHFTPLGWQIWESMQAARLHPQRGVPYTPVALMLPRDHGWYPQPNWYAKHQANCVWGNIPYAPGDFQIDRFFQYAYSGYKLANWGTDDPEQIKFNAKITMCPSRDERGKVTNTPLGDSFDVILSNADMACLSKYQAVVLLGGHDVDADPELGKRLAEFVHGGGLVVADAGQWKKIPGRKDKANLSKTSGRTTGAVPLRLGKGEIIIIPTAFWGAADVDSKVFAAAMDHVAARLRDFLLIEIEGRPIYHLVNVTDRPDEILVTLCNNSQDLPWEGEIRICGQEIETMEEWLAFGEAEIHNGALRCGVPANNVRVYRLKARRPFLNLRFHTVPWKKLGYGVPEWPDKI